MGGIVTPRRGGALWLVVGLLAAALGGSPALASGSRSPATDVRAMPQVTRPLTIPALQRWWPGSGRWHLGTDARIVVAAGSGRDAVAEAHHLASDLKGVVGRVLAVRSGVAARAGDVELTRVKATSASRPAGYDLRIGRVLTIAASTSTGLFYGGRSVIQLLRQGRSIGRGSAQDWPRYAERGLMVDVSRTVYSTRWVLREIRRLAALKLNVLHLHLTDDERWAITSSSYPGIVSRHALTKSDIGRIVRLAHRDHVTVIPEIEMPGHMAAFLSRHPGLALKPTGLVTPTTSGRYTTDKLDITSPAALRAMRRILDEYLPMFPGKYWDIGVDEYLSPAEYPLFPQLATYALKTYGLGATPADTIHGFINWVDGIVRAHGKTLRIWNDQVGGTGRVPVNRDVVIDWWDSFSPFGDPVTVSPQTLIDDGYRVLNAGWYPNYYTSNIGPISGKASLPGVYAGWRVNDFDGNEFGKLVSSKQKVPATSPGLLGAALSVWGTLDETTAQTASGIEPRLAVLAQKTWDSALPAPDYAAFARDLRRVDPSVLAE